MSVKDDVDRGLEIRAELERLLLELKEIEKRLQVKGLSAEQIPLEDKEREGRQWIAEGTRSAVPVIFTADIIVGSFAQDSAMHMELRGIFGEKLKELFKPIWKNRFDDGKAFRARVRELYPEKAPLYITACLARDKQGIPKSKSVVAWNEPRPVAP